MVRASFTRTHCEQKEISISPLLLQEPCVLGIDEAGRGPVLGPMVYGVAFCPESKKEQLKNLGVDDSKKLTEEQRDAFFDQICAESDWLGWTIRALTPRDISWAMLRRHKYNLNALSHDTAIDLIRHTLNQGVRLTEIYVDTVGPPDKYQSKLEGLFPGIKITVSKGADHLFPIVSAASICAKVTRDQMLSHWEFAEPGLNASTELGSGYPGDSVTKTWLRENMDPVFGFPEIVRYSWSTCKKLLEDEAIQVHWPLEDEEDTPDVELYPGQKRKQQTTLDSFTGQKKSTETTRPPMYSSMCHVSDF